MYMKDCKSWSRIDYFLISSALHSHCAYSEIKPSANMDHFFIVKELDTRECKRGPDIWKFNLLNEENFGGHLKTVIQSCKSTFGHLNPMELWDLNRVEITQQAREWSKTKANDILTYMNNCIKICW